nr:recombinase family protein [Mycobacterium paraseoulense]
MYAKRTNSVRPGKWLEVILTAPGIREGNRAVAYLRVSTDEQSVGLEAQRAAIDSIAKQRGLEIVGEFVDENVSGSLEIIDRPALLKALVMLSDKEADRLVVSKLDRLARNTIVALQLDRTAEKHGWAIIFGDIDIDTSTAAGKLQLSMFASFSQFERDRIAERTREALAIKRSQGVALGRPVELPQNVIARIVSERKQGKSIRGIARDLTADGVPTARGGKAWQPSTVQRVLESKGSK